MLLKRRKTKSNTPITIGLSKKESDNLKKLIRPSLQAFKENKQTPTDWQNIGFRLKVAVEIAKEFYSDENAEDLQKCLDVIIVLKERYLKTISFLATTKEVELMELGLDTMDELQDRTTRRILLDKHIVARDFMNKLSRS